MRHGCHVIMACRNNARCEEARAELMQRGLPGTAECMQVHLDNMTSVRAFAANVVQKLHRAKRQLRVLVNNAGVCNSYRSVMTYNKIVHKSHACAPHPATGVMAVPPDPHDGLDGHLRPNHFGPFLLTCCLANTLDHKGARIVNVGGGAAGWGDGWVDGCICVGVRWVDGCICVGVRWVDGCICVGVRWVDGCICVGVWWVAWE